MKQIESESDIAEGLDELLRLDARLVPIAQRAGPLPLRPGQPEFEGLAETVVSQHVSKTSAAAVYKRLRKRIAPFSAANFIEAGSKPLIDAGLTRAKQQTLTMVAQKICDGQLDLQQICQAPVTEALQKLTSIKGIGKWTGEVFLLLCAGHVDIFPAGDVALRHAVGVGLALGTRPSEQHVRGLSQIVRATIVSVCCLALVKPDSING